MKKLLCLILSVLCLCTLFTGCGKSQPLLQETPVEKGETIAVMETSMGTIKQIGRESCRERV